MVKVQEHIELINNIKVHIANSKGNQRKQFIKRLHRLQKELAMYKIYQK